MNRQKPDKLIDFSITLMMRDMWRENVNQLQELPTEGVDQWCPLESRNGNGHLKRKRGDIHLKMALGAEKEKKVAAQEYRHVLHLLLVHELDEENVEPHQWEGRFSSKSAFILRTLELQGGLTRKDIEIAQWLVYTRVQCEHPLNAKVFPPLFEAIIQHVKNQRLGEDEVWQKKTSNTTSGIGRN